MSRSLPSLRNVLLADAITCAVMGAVLVLASRAIGQLTQIPPALLLYAGLSLFPIAGFMAAVASRPAPHPLGVCLIIAGNAGWVAGSLLLVLTDWIAPNLLGSAFIVAQAIAVAGLATLEFGALRATNSALSTS